MSRVATFSVVIPAQAGIHIPETLIWGMMGPRNGVPATLASRGAPRGDDGTAKRATASQEQP